MFVLFNFLASVVLGMIDNYVLGASILGGLYSLAVLVPSIAVGVRRLHDIGKSGWMLLVALIPIAGIIWLIILLVKEGVSGENEYGANPKEAVVEA